MYLYVLLNKLPLKPLLGPFYVFFLLPFSSKSATSQSWGFSLLFLFYISPLGKTVNGFKNIYIPMMSNCTVLSVANSYEIAEILNCVSSV